MKKLFAIGAVMVLAVRLTAFAVAGEKPDLGSSEKYNRAELNLLIGLQSDNLGLRESSAYMLGELKSGKAVIPLMHMLRQDEHESSRVVAALALCQIGDARGAFAVKRAAKFDESSRVQARCAWFYDQYVSPGTFIFVAIGMPESVDMAAK